MSSGSGPRPHHGGNLSWAAALADCAPHQILDFSASINPLGPPPSVLAVIQEHLGDLQAYPDPQATALKVQLAHLHQVPPDWVLVGNGAAELLTWACRSLGQLAQVHLLTPAFGDYGRALQAFAVNSYSHALIARTGKDFRILEAAQILRQVQGGPGTGLLLNNPHNPTGQRFTKATVEDFVQRFERVVIDEAFMDFLPDAENYSFLGELLQHPQVIILRSLTKFYSIPGLRLGYAVGHPDVLRQWQAWRDPWSVNTLAIAAGVAAVQDRGFQAQTYAWLAAAAPQLRQGLAALPGLTVIPGCANFVLVHSDHSVLPIQEALLKQHRIFIRDCLSFPELGDTFFRVAVRTEAENESLLKALTELLCHDSVGEKSPDKEIGIVP